MIDRLHVLLDSLGYDLAAPEMLDVLWLARAMGPASPAPEQPAGPPALRPDDAPVVKPVGDAGPGSPAAPSQAARDPRVTAQAAEPAG
ncbi:hypothetical protein AB0L68_41505, partial [Streptomyces sp. NPDC052164]